MAAFNVVDAYTRILSQDDSMSMPVAAILALVQLIEASQAQTVHEFILALDDGVETLKKAFSNPVGLSAGAELFKTFANNFSHNTSDLISLKKELITEGRNYAEGTKSYRGRIAESALKFIQDDTVILTHSYSRVVMEMLLHAHRHKRISVYVTEARPKGLGMKTCEILTAAGIPCSVILDSAVAYTMDKVDLVLVGSEAVVESGGLVNAIGSCQIAVVAKAAQKPFYAAAESFKFLRLYPISAHDLPTHSARTLSFPSVTAKVKLAQPAETENGYFPPHQEFNASKPGTPTSSFAMNEDQLSRNPDVDYTRPDLITLVFSDVGILTPSGVSQYLVGIHAG